MADTIKVRLTIEPSWASAPYTEVVEIDAAELEGLSSPAREDRIADICEESVSNLCPWGFEEVG